MSPCKFTSRKFILPVNSICKGFISDRRRSLVDSVISSSVRESFLETYPRIKDVEMDESYARECNSKLKSFVDSMNSLSLNIFFLLLVEIHHRTM